MTEELTVEERLKRLKGIANDTKIAHLQDEDGLDPHTVINNLDEIRAGLGNILRDINETIDDDQPRCVHCGSPFTYTRSDGDTGCHDCHGIMPHEVNH